MKNFSVARNFLMSEKFCRIKKNLNGLNNFLETKNYLIPVQKIVRRTINFNIKIFFVIKKTASMMWADVPTFFAMVSE
jgi:hypothetical protein